MLIFGEVILPTYKEWDKKWSLIAKEQQKSWETFMVNHTNDRWIPFQPTIFEAQKRLEDFETLNPQVKFPSICGFTWWFGIHLWYRDLGGALAFQANRYIIMEIERATPPPALPSPRNKPPLQEY